MDDVTDDLLFGGALNLRQPARGHRIGTDAVLLAASVPADAGNVADLGTGAGAVGLRAAQVLPDARVTLIDDDAEILSLAEHNIAANGLASRVVALKADALNRRDAALRACDCQFDVVLTNPPYFTGQTTRTSPVPARARAHVLTGPLEEWVACASRLLAPRGRLVLVHRADALLSVLAAISSRFGAVRILPVLARVDAPAMRVLVGGIRGSRAPLQLLPPLVLHGPDGAFSPHVDAIHRGDRAIPLWPQDVGKA